MMGNWVPWWHWLWMGGVWIVVIAVIVWAVTALFPNQPGRGPQQILDERLALGEISMDEYRQRCDELAAHTRSTDRPGA